MSYTRDYMKSIKTEIENYGLVAALCPRRSGATTMLVNRAKELLLNQDKYGLMNIVYICNSDDECERVMDLMKISHDLMNSVDMALYAINTLSFKNGSRFSVIVGCDNTHAMRGRTHNVVFVDNAYDKYFHSSIWPIVSKSVNMYDTTEYVIMQNWEDYDAVEELKPLIESANSKFIIFTIPEKDRWKYDLRIHTISCPLEEKYRIF